MGGVGEACSEMCGYARSYRSRVTPTRFGLVRFARAARRDTLSALEIVPDAPLARPGFRIPLLLVQDFFGAKEVLISNEAAFSKPGFVRRIIVAGLGRNLFTAQGEEWLTRRRPVAPVFAATNMNSLASIMASSVDEHIRCWEPGSRDLQAEMTDLTLKVACRALLGIDPDEDDLGQRIRTAFETLLAWVAAHLLNPALPPSSVPTPGNRAMKRAKANLHATVRELIADRRASSTDTDDVLGRLLRSQADDHELTDDHIVDECVGFLFAGHETTASTLTWALYELAMHPEAQQQVAADGEAIDLADPALHDRTETMAATAGVVDEALRLYPSGISIVRIANKTTEISGHRVRRGTMVMIAVYRIQRLPSVWSQPDEFDPKRTAEPTIDGMCDSFLPFGLGPRRCLGARFARTEMRLALAQICSRWHLIYEEDVSPEPEVKPSLRIAGTLPITLTPRSAPTA